MSLSAIAVLQKGAQQQAGELNVYRIQTVYFKRNCLSMMEILECVVYSCI